MPTSDAVRLLAPGVVINLGGAPYTVRIDMQKALLLEEEFGGLDECLFRLQTPAWKTKLTDLRRALAIAIPELTADQITERMEGPQLRSYLDGLLEAISQFLPSPAEGDENPKAEGEEADSPGGASITPEPSPTAAATASSGA